MAAQHCPFCNTSNIFALGAVAYSDSVLVEHRCIRCGHIFCISDRRDLKSKFPRKAEPENIAKRESKSKSANTVAGSKSKIVLNQ